MAITISVLALLATFYQLYLQRVHNEKSLKPWGQITLGDHDNSLSVRLYNNGLGPLIMYKLTFTNGSMTHPSIKACLDLDPKSYMYVSMDDLTERIILPGSSLTIFEKNIQALAAPEADHLRQQLSQLTIQADCWDIYDNKITVRRSFQWFSRHLLLQDAETTS